MNDFHILVVEDEPSLAEIVCLYLKRAGYEVTALDDGRAAVDWMARQMPGLVILDIMLPGMDGFAITRWIRDRGDVPIIMLTSRREESDRIAGLEMGADDYVLKPFSPQELVSRVRAVLRRTHAAVLSAGGEKALDFGAGALRIEPQTRLVKVNGQEVSLTAKEFDMLYHLASHPRQVFSRDHLLEAIWGVSEYIDPGTVTVHIRRLREKIEADPAKPAHLQTVWGVGYRFEP
ncbi:MAG: response regulator transcription factor [Chloroflexota bacterium]